MNKKELATLEEELWKEAKRRRNLGAYDTNAECLMFLTKCLALVVTHLNKKPAKKKKK